MSKPQAIRIFGVLGLWAVSTWLCSISGGGWALAGAFSLSLTVLVLTAYSLEVSPDRGNRGVPLTAPSGGGEQTVGARGTSLKRSGNPEFFFLLAFPIFHHASLPEGPSIQAFHVWGWLALLALLAAAKRSTLPIAFLLALLVVYFSGNAGGPDPMRAWLATFLSVSQIENALFLIRKTIHFTFYFTLASMAWLGFDGHSKGRRFAISLAFSLATSIFDESRQLAAAGRSGQVWDVLLDSAGALAALGLLFRQASGLRGRA